MKVLPILNSVFTFLNNLVPVFYRYGARRVCRVPFGYCRYTHLMSDEQLRNFDGRIYYFGTYGPLIEKWLQPLLKFNLVIHGHDWENAKSPAIRKAAMWDVAHDRKMSETASGQLVVNFIRAQHGAGHSLKTFELPAAGACVITNRSEEQLEFFPEDSNVSYFDTKSEMESLVREFIKSPERIRQKLHKRKSYLEKQSYHERAVIMLEELEDSFKQGIPGI